MFATELGGIDDPCRARNSMYKIPASSGDRPAHVLLRKYNKNANLYLEKYVCLYKLCIFLRENILVVQTLYVLRNTVIPRFRPHNRCWYFIYVISSRALASTISTKVDIMQEIRVIHINLCIFNRN